MYANIIVNISHDNLDKTFQYLVPNRLADSISVGDYVSIPFGKSDRLISGYVLELTDQPQFDPSRQKEIADIVTDSHLVESKLISLAYWMKRKYGSTMITALKTVLPIKKNVKPIEERTILLKMPVEEAYDQLRVYEKKHQVARYRLLKELIAERQLDYRLVTGKLNISAATLKLLEQQEVLTIESKRIYRDVINSYDRVSKCSLNEEQREVAEHIISDYQNGLHNVSLIHGITGSGKTEVYMEVIEAVVKSNRQVIVLIPEIALTYQTVLRFYKRFGDRVSTLHSKLSDGEKYDQFERARKGEISVMIGPRSALFTPFSNLGLIVIDEEHEGAYKSDSMPKYHAREVAIELARLHGASVVLGSATPSMESYYEALSGNYRLYRLTKRAKEASLPNVEIVDLREELKSGNRSIFSGRLQTLMEERLLRNEQVMLFINRRGYAGFVSCRSCGEVIKCPHCDVSLSEHRGGKLICHYCGYEQNAVSECPACHSKLIGGMRAGTEQIEDKIKKMFPFARVLRMDADTTKTKDSYDKILSSFANHEADILVGTQMIVKGHDFPYVTLVGILAADMSLYANDYRAGERTFQLLTQAAGRAGRADLKGEVVIQTYNPEHYSVVSAAKQDYEAFYREEIAYRGLLSYPPVAHLWAILIESTIENEAESFSEHLAAIAKDVIMDGVVGPADATVRKVNDIYRRVLYVKSKDVSLLLQVKDLMESDIEANPNSNIRVSFDFDPLHGY